MANYHKLPWQRNIRRLPTFVTEKLLNFSEGTGIVPVCTKRITAAQLKSGVFHHLKMKLVDYRPSFSTIVLPSDSVGQYCAKNCNGWELKRPDLPMISKTICLGNRPIYGDWSNGSFPLWQERMVYQIDEYAPTDYSIEIDLLATTDRDFVFKFSLDCVLDSRDADFDEDLLFCLNIL